MAISQTAVVRAQCDACPTVAYADSPNEPKGVQGTAREVDGNGVVTLAEYFACQIAHVGAAARNTLKAAKDAAKRAGSVAPTAEPVPVAQPAPVTVSDITRKPATPGDSAKPQDGRKLA